MRDLRIARGRPAAPGEGRAPDTILMGGLGPCSICAIAQEDGAQVKLWPSGPGEKKWAEACGLTATGGAETVVAGCADRRGWDDWMQWLNDSRVVCVAMIVVPPEVGPEAAITETGALGFRGNIEEGFAPDWGDTVGWRKRVWTGVRDPPPGFAVPSLEPPTRAVPETEFQGEGWLEVYGGQFEPDARPVEPEPGVARRGRWKEPDKVEPGAHVRVRGRKGVCQVRSLEGDRANLSNAVGPISVPLAAAIPAGVRYPVYGSQQMAAVTPGSPERLGMLGQLIWNGTRAWKAAGERVADPPMYRGFGKLGTVRTHARSAFKGA